MTLNDIIKMRFKWYYQIQHYKGKSFLEWAVLWFKTSNDVFFSMYGFNFNPYEYPMLYEIAREEVYG